MDTKKALKIAKWSGLGLVGAVLITLGVAATIFYTAGSRYEGSLEGLIPHNALLVLRFDNLGERLPQFEKDWQAQLKQRGLTHFAQAPLYKEAFDEGQAIAPSQIWDVRVDPVLSSLRQQLANMPMGLTLEKDLLRERTFVAMLPMPKNEGMHTLLITRISSDLAGAWQFSGFAEGSHGASTISSDDGIMQIATTKEGGASSSVYLTLFDDVLMASPSRDAVSSASSLRDALFDSESFKELELLERAQKSVEAHKGSDMLAFANLDALREYQGIDPLDANLPEAEQRAKLDKYFTIPPAIVQLSPMLLPTINDVIGYTIDTRAFGMAAWSFDISNAGQIDIHQHLIVDEKRLNRSELEHLKQSWSQGAQAWDFLEFLPADTWFLGSVNQALDTLGADVKPVKNEQGEEEASAVYSMLKAISSREGADVNSVGMAMLPTNQRYWADPSNPDERELVAAGLVSDASFPPFVFFMHWPGVEIGDVQGLMAEQLEIQGVSSLFAEFGNVNGKRVVMFKTVPGKKPLPWISNQIACGVIGDYMVISLSKGYTAMMDLLDGADTLAKGKDRPFGDVMDQGYALMYLRPQGFEQYSKIIAYDPPQPNPNRPEVIDRPGKVIDLAEATARAKFKEDYPFGMDSVSYRKQLAAEMGLPVESPAVGREFQRKKLEWIAQRGPYAQDMRANIRMTRAIKDFVAATKVSTKAMHTHFVIRIAER